jgi:hypothetical protein
VRQCATVRASVVCGSVHGSVWQCARQRETVRSIVYGSASGSVRLCDYAAVCGSVAVCGNTSGSVWQCAQ